MSRGFTPKRVGEALLESGELTEAQLTAALEEQRRTGLKLGEILVAEGLVTPESLVKAIGRCRGVAAVKIRGGLIDPRAMELLGRSEAERLRCVPLFKVRDVLTVAMADPGDLPAIDRIAELTGLTVRPVLALETNVTEYLGKRGDTGADIDEFLTTLTDTDLAVIEKEAIDEDPIATDLERMVDGSPIVNLVNMAIVTAIREGASDIHVEPSERGTRIRCRVDGVLRDLMRPPLGMHAAVVSRIKVLARMDIAQKRLPQEGRVRIIAEGRGIDLRISSMPTLLGEKMVVRILDKQKLSVRLEQLGFSAEALRGFTEALNQPHGLVLVTGPTGSGKTTTLYSALDLLRGPEVNIVTVEDPVEYQLDLINQIQVNEHVGLGFGRALRSILRQDPDVIMIGEIRDEDTAHVAVQAALTGHMVLATLHTNDSAGTVARLRDMGVHSYLLSSALTCVVAQRLARTNCPHCVTGYYPTPEALAEACIPAMTGRPFRRGEGCPRCRDSGFLGRLGVYEIMHVSGSIRRLIHADADAAALRRAQRRAGSGLLRDEAVRHAVGGLISLDEAMQVTRLEDVTGGEHGDGLEAEAA